MAVRTVSSTDSCFFGSFPPRADWSSVQLRPVAGAHRGASSTGPAVLRLPHRHPREAAGLSPPLECSLFVQVLIVDVFVRSMISLI